MLPYVFNTHYTIILQNSRHAYRYKLENIESSPNSNLAVEILNNPSFSFLKLLIYSWSKQLNKYNINQWPTNNIIHTNSN